MGGPCILILAALIGLAVWFVALVRESFSPRGDPSQPRHVGKLALQWGLWIFGLLFVVALLLPIRSMPREVVRRARCVNNLKQIGLAMSAYHDAYQCFPPAYTVDAHGQPLHSWRTLLLPFMEHETLYAQLRLDEPWNSPHNQTVLTDREAPSVLRCPSAEDDKRLTNYAMIVGPGTISDGTSCLRREDIADGPDNTIIVVEVTDCGTHWAEPRDLEFQRMSFKISDPAGDGIASAHPGVANALFADGTVHWISKDVDPELLKALMTIAGGEDVGAFWADY